MTTQITLKDLSKILGLAPSTVSRALKGHPDISDKTKETVRKLSEELQYTPNIVALNLRKQKSNLIAIIIPNMIQHYFACIISGATRLANSQDYNVIVFESNEEYEQEVAICHSIPKTGVAGILIAMAKTTRKTDHFKALKKTGIPLVFFDRICGDIDTDRVITDDFNGAYMAVRHMITTGCRRIAHFAAEQHLLMAQKRQMGYIQALLDQQIPIDRQLIIPCDNQQEAEYAIRELVKKQQIDGVFAVNDWTAVGVLRSLDQIGYKVPEEIAVCGFSGEPFASILTPTLTTVVQDGREMGEIAAGLLLKRLNTKENDKTETHILKVNLEIRRSTQF